jgi:hypothetical protein
MILAGGMPLLLAATILAWVAVDLDADYLPGQGAANVQVAKIGGSVVFTIENGDREHRISRSLRPDSFDSAGTVKVMEGTFRDDLDSGSDLVFYRID